MPPRELVSRRNLLHRARGDDSGFALTWFAIMLVVLMAMAGFSVDVWNWWYTAQKAQNAADAGALGGVVLLPDSSAANSRAKEIVGQNGFSPSSTTTAVGTNLNDLTVTVDTTVTNFFTGLLGLETTDISRDATAEFTGDVPMGSPENYLGTDPDDPSRSLDHWLSVSGRNDTKIGGDRYQNLLCGGAAFCTGGINDEYDKNGYRFVINLNEAPTSDLNVEVWDAGNNGMSGQDCAGEGGGGSHLPSSFDRSQIMSQNETSGHPGWPDADVRFHSGRRAPAPGNEFYCNGDVSDSSNVTTFIMRAPDGTPGNDFDNPVMTGSCAPKQYRGAQGGNYLQRLLDVYNGAGTERDKEFASNFRQWVNICTISQTDAQAAYNLFGPETRWILQVRSNSPLGNPCANPPGCDAPASTEYNKRGRNHFSLRAGLGSSLSGDVRVFANGRLPMHAAVQGADTEFYVARVPSANAGRFLQIQFFDTGDAAAAGKIKIVQPDESDGSMDGNKAPFASCTFARNDGATLSSSGCVLSGVHRANGYDGRVVTATVTIPSTYKCNDASPLGCWVKVQFPYPAGTNVLDHTVWSAGIVGDPVRLTK